MTNEDIYADKALAIYDTTYKKVMEKAVDGEIEVIIDKKKKKVFWSDYYTFTEEQFENWKKYVMGDLKRKNPQLTEDLLLVKFYQIDMVYGLSQPYLFVHQIEEVSSPQVSNLLDTPDY